MRVPFGVFAATLLLLGGCQHADDASSTTNQITARRTVQLTIASVTGTHAFKVEFARNAAEQERGLMYRTDIADDGGMLFAPYPPGGGAPAEASFWMKNTPSPLDIIFIRADHTIARIAENAIPFDQTPISSGEAVAAVLELKGGRSTALGIAEGDKVRWQDD